MKTIKLTKGRFTIVDDDLFEFLNQYKWHYQFGYAKRMIRVNGQRKALHLHRFIINAPNHLQVDHINGDSLDNRRENLRLCSQKDNAKNRSMSKNNKSGFPGVYYYEKYGKYCAQATVNGSKKTLGYFDTKEEAFEARQEVVKEHYKSFAPVNPFRTAIERH